MVENSKIGRIIFFRIRSSTGYKISENLDRISARRKLCGDSVPCIIWTDALECMDCRTGMWNCISHDIEMVTDSRTEEKDKTTFSSSVSIFRSKGLLLLPSQPQEMQASAFQADSRSLEKYPYSGSSSCLRTLFPPVTISIS